MRAEGQKVGSLLVEDATVAALDPLPAVRVSRHKRLDTFNNEVAVGTAVSEAIDADSSNREMGREVLRLDGDLDMPIIPVDY